MSFYGIFLQVRNYVKIYTAIKVEFLLVEKECITFEIDFFITSEKYSFRCSIYPIVKTCIVQLNVLKFCLVQLISARSH